MEIDYPLLAISAMLAVAVAGFVITHNKTQAEHGAEIKAVKVAQAKQAIDSKDRDKLLFKKIDQFSVYGKDIAVLNIKYDNLKEQVERDCA